MPGYTVSSKPTAKAEFFVFLWPVVFGRRRRGTASVMSSWLWGDAQDQQTGLR